MANLNGSDIPYNEIPREIKDLFDKGMQAFARNNYEYAIELFSRALRLKFDFADARHYLRLSQQRFFKERPPKFLTKTVNKLKCLIYKLRALIFRLRGDIKRSIYEYEKLLYKEPFNEKVLLELAIIFRRENQADSALRTFEEVVQLNPKNINALKNLGELYMQTDDLSKARSCFKTVLSISPRDLDVEKFLRDLDALGTLKKNFPK